MSYAVCNLDKVLAGYNGNIESVKHSAAMEQGSFINLGGLVTGETELREVSIPATASLTTAEILLVHAPELIYDTYNGYELSNFVNAANRPTRAYHLVAGDIFSISEDGIDSLPTPLSGAVGKYIIAQDGSVVPKYSATDAGTARFAGQIIAIETFGVNELNMVVIQVLRS